MPQTVSHIVKVLEKDGRVKTYQTTTANAADDHDHTDVIDHFTKVGGKKGAEADPVRVKQFFGKNFDQIISVEKGQSKHIPDNVKKLMADAKLPKPVMEMITAPKVETPKVETPVTATTKVSELVPVKPVETVVDDEAEEPKEPEKLEDQGT